MQIYSSGDCKTKTIMPYQYVTLHILGHGVNFGIKQCEQYSLQDKLL